MSVSTAGSPPAPELPLFEIKSAQLPLVAMHLRSSDWDLLGQEILARFGPTGESPGFFENDALVIDFSQLDAQLPVVDLVPLLKTIRQCNLIPVALRGSNADWMAYGLGVGLIPASQEVYHAKKREEKKEIEPAVVQEPVQEPVQERSTMVIDKPLRSGQKVYARGADLVVLAMVNQGAEVVADGNIHVYAPLRGKAMAGARGNTKARIFSTCMEPELISIAGIYRISEVALSSEIHGKAAQVRLSNDGKEKLIIEALKAQ
jgi:septum site-determining protein MinC